MTVREELEQAVERAIDALNELDGDAEAERDYDGEEGAEGEAWVQSVSLFN